MKSRIKSLSSQLHTGTHKVELQVRVEEKLNLFAAKANKIMFYGAAVNSIFRLNDLAAPSSDSRCSAKKQQKRTTPASPPFFSAKYAEKATLNWPNSTSNCGCTRVKNPLIHSQLHSPGGSIFGAGKPGLDPQRAAKLPPQNPSTSLHPSMEVSLLGCIWKRLPHFLFKIKYGNRRWKKVRSSDITRVRSRWNTDNETEPPEYFRGRG